MHRDDVIQSIVFSAHALARIAAHETGNDTPAAQWRALSVLDTEGALRVGDLAHRSRTTQPGMTRMVGLLEKDGLAERSADPADSRATLVSITEHGRAALESWRRELQTVLEPRFADLDADDWTHLSRAAEILRTRTAPERTPR
ncbi:hypothetical protein GCM10025768_12590 [Microbacterium pseudoresistens]|uniref:DNA-binding MarR family transcriptional regulator n=1 Tax=Microbacterium pseudoresistens TaxID=640634 RepID=A0A7Y9JMT1_9MICO|nr:MarR family transcriptional regulator [Microbacterium pseudoresistens]NYD55162.1 DNA-binding MarR family transcriptional regulator [Microbacterium pseudoresistens]